METTKEHLRVALQGDRNIGVATGIITERHRMSAAEAFELLRKRARSQRQRVSEVAEQLVAAAEIINRREE